VAELVATGNRPCIIDVGGWTVGDRTRFFVDFAQALFRHTRGPRWLCIDEVHNFAAMSLLAVQLRTFFLLTRTRRIEREKDPDHPPGICAPRDRMREET
jgi:hypothetical protein